MDRAGAGMNLTERDRRERIRLRAVRATGLANARGSTTLDTLARVARRTLRAHAAYVTLVDEAEQFAPGCASEDRDDPLRAVPIERSICRHLVGKTSPLVIPDTTESPLTRDIVPELGVGAYLGVPLADVHGNTLGALCAVERAARAWSEEDVGALAELAAAARAELARAEREERFALAIEATAEVVYSFDLVDGHVWRQGAIARIFGQDDRERAETREAWIAAIGSARRGARGALAALRRFSPSARLRAPRPRPRRARRRPRGRSTRRVPGTCDRGRSRSRTG